MFLEKEKIQDIVEATRQYILGKEPFPDPGLRIGIEEERMDKFTTEIQNGVCNAVLYLYPFRKLIYKKDKNSFILTLFAGLFDNDVDEKWTKIMEQQFKGLHFRSLQGPQITVEKVLKN